MLTHLLMLTLIVLVVAAMWTTRAGASDNRWLLKVIRNTRDRVHLCQDSLGVRRSPAASLSPASSRAYLRWVRWLWLAREQAYCEFVRAAADPRVAIRVVFGRHAEEALRVFWCESRYDTQARNGQYQGIAQMGQWERSRFGHGDTALEQARAAHRYFVLSGWRPWECARIEGVI